MPSLDEDLDAIVADPAFSTCATFTLAGGSELCVDGIFTSASDAALMFGNVDIEAQQASFTAKTSALATVTTKITVTIDGNDYIVERLQKLGTGMSVVYLKTKRG